jgi:hypothetical protein
MDNDIDSLEEPKVKGYSVVIDESLYKRLEKHVRILKHFEQTGLTKHKWIMDAIKTKLAKEDKSQDLELPKNRYLVLKINDLINNKIDATVDLQKRFRRYSKKQWLIEAICEQLEAEENKTKQLLGGVNTKET